MKQSLRKYGLEIISVLLLSFSLVSNAADRETDFNTHYGTEGPEEPEEQEQPEKPDPCEESGTGSPVYLKDMTLVWSDTDVVLRGTPAIRITRTFNSYDSIEGIFGKGWSVTCERALIKTIATEIVSEGEEDSIKDVIKYVYRLSNGRRYQFVENDQGEIESPAGLSKLTLEPLVDGARLVAQSGAYSEFNSLGQLVAKVDKNSNAIFYSYEEGALTQITDGNGRYLDLTYDTLGHVETVTDHTDRQWIYAYNDDGTLASVTNPMDGVYSYDYDIYQADNSAETYALLKNITDETDVSVIDVTYANDARVKTYSEGENIYTYTEVNAQNKYKVDSQGSKWTYWLNDAGQKIQVMDPDNKSSYYLYDADGRAIQVVGKTGIQIDKVYDDLGRLTEVTTPEGTATWAYVDDSPVPTTVTSITGRESEYFYDAQYNLVGFDDAADIHTSFERDDSGKLTAVVDAADNRSEISYDEIGQPIKTIDAQNNQIIITRDVRGNVATITNAEGEVTAMVYDDLDRVVSEADPAGNIVEYTYDVASRVKTISTVANDAWVTYEYDNFGRLSKKVDFDGGEELYTYRTDNMTYQYTDKAGNVTTYAYLANKQIDTVSLADDTIDYQYNAEGRVSDITNNVGTVSFTYDAMGRLLTQTSNGETITYVYNLEGEVVGYTAMGEEVTYDRDVRGLVDTIHHPAGDFVNTFDSLGQRTNVSRPNATSTAYSYDSLGQLEQVHHQGAIDIDYNYGFDSVGRITTWQGDVEDKTYGYDLASRITSTDYAGGDQEQFDYDLLGNRANDNATFDLANRLDQDDAFDYTYDLNGNCIEKLNKITGEKQAFTYNTQNQLTKFEKFANQTDTTPMNTATYTYGPLGKRWSKTVDAATTDFIWSGSNMIAEITDTSTKKYFYEGLNPLVMNDNGTDYFYHTDHLSTPKAMTDSIGTQVWSGQLNTFGEVVSEAGYVENNLRFPGQYHDRETGLYYNYYRYYDPSIGRYVTSDPVGLRGGVNTYAYTGGNPIVYIDPLGLERFLGDDLAQQYLNDSGGDGGDAWNDIRGDRDSTKPVVPGSAGSDHSEEIRNAEHYLYSYSEVQDNSYYWGPMHTLTTGYNTVKFWSNVAEYWGEGVGIDSPWTYSMPTSDELDAGYAGANDALFGRDPSLDCD